MPNDNFNAIFPQHGVAEGELFMSLDLTPVTQGIIKQGLRLVMYFPGRKQDCSNKDDLNSLTLRRSNALAQRI